jgi:hypothetical protein
LNNPSPPEHRLSQKIDRLCGPQLDWRRRALNQNR